MGGANNVSHTICDGHFCHRDGNLEGLCAVVETGQDMTMNVDHSEGLRDLWPDAGASQGVGAPNYWLTGAS